MNDEWVERTLANLLALAGSSGNKTLTLDQIGDEVGAAAITPREIESLIDRLQESGVTVGDSDGPDLPELLRKVLSTARKLRSEGRRPERQAIARRSGLSESAVRIALLYADVLRG